MRQTDKVVVVAAVAAMLLSSIPTSSAINGELQGATAPSGYTGAQFQGAYCPCETIQYPNLPFGYQFVQMGTDAIDAWLNDNPNPQYIIAHSEGAQSFD